MAGLGSPVLGGIGLGITQGMYDRQADTQTRLDRLRLDAAKDEAATDKSVRENLKAAADRRRGVQRAAPQGDGAQVAPDTTGQAGVAPSQGAQMQPADGAAAPNLQPAAAGGAASPAAQSSIGPAAGAAPTPPAAAPQQVAAQARPTFDPDLQLEQAQVMIESGHPKYMALGQTMAENAMKLKSAKRADEQTAAIYGAMHAQNSLINTFHDKESGAQNAVEYLTGPGQAYMNRVNYGGQNYQIMQDGKGGLVAVSHDPSGKITSQLPVTKDNVVPLATSVAQTQTLNILGQSSPDLMFKLFENNMKQQTADAATTGAQSSWQNSMTQAKDTDAKLAADLYGAQAGQARASGQAALMQGSAALMNARSMEQYRQSQIDKIQATIDNATSKMPEAQKLMFQQLKSNADLATKAALADPQNVQAQVASKSATLKLAKAYTAAKLIPAGSEYEYAGIPAPADAATAIMADNPSQQDINRNLTGASIYGKDYAAEVAQRVKAIQDAKGPAPVQTPGVKRGITSQQLGPVGTALDKLTSDRAAKREANRTSSGKVGIGTQ